MIATRFASLARIASVKTSDIMAKRKSENKPNQLKGRLRLTPRSVARGSETLDAYSKRQADEKAARDAVEQAKRERFRKSCEQGRRHFSIRKIRKYWLEQLDIAASFLGAEPLDYISGELELEKDKPVVYALMTFCIDEGSLFRIVPESVESTKWYVDRHRILFWVCERDLSSELLSYIEADLKAEGLIPESIDNSTKPQVRTVQAENDFKQKRDIKKRFTVNSGQAQFDGKDLRIPTGLACDVLEKLVNQFGDVVKYKDLDDNSLDKEASEQLRKVKRVIVKSFEVNKVPCAVKSKARHGYVITKKTFKKTTKRSSKTHHK